MVHLKNLVKDFDGRGRVYRALDNVTLEIDSGEIVGVIGSSGAGKSTLIRCVNLLERPDSGEVVVAGRDLLKLSADQLTLARRQVGMVFQHFHLLSSRTVFENVLLPLELAGMARQGAASRVYELLDLVGLREKAADYPVSLSGGQKQRVAIARSLAPNPRVLLCDEATSALDPETTRTILSLLKEINQSLKLTILLITHEMEVVKAICDRVAVMERGRLSFQGEVAEVLVRTQAHRLELPPEYLGQLARRTVLRLGISHQSQDEPFLSELYRRYRVDAKIISAQLDCVGGKKFGSMLLELSGEQARSPELLDYLRGLRIEIEVLGDV